MGFKGGWLAVENVPKSELLLKLGWEDSDEVDEYFEEDTSAADMTTGWSLIQFHDFAFVETLELGALSQIAPLVACQIHEGTMFVRAQYWRNGEQIWSIEHDSQIDRLHLSSSGALPACFQEISAKNLAEQEGDDEVDFIFDTPLAVAKSLCGYKHDEWDAELFVATATRVMRPIPLKQRKKLFGIF
jgi:hypothetical protein